MGRPKAQITTESSKKNISLPADVFRQQTTRFIVRLAVALGVSILLFLVLNAGYFWRQLAYTLGTVGQQVSIVPDMTPSDEPIVEPLAAHQIRIPSIDVLAPIIYVDEIDHGVFSEALHRGVVHYPHTALPGEPGNVYLFGHSSDWVGADSPYRYVFALVPRLEPGDVIEVSNAEGVVFRYRVTEGFVVSPKDTYVLDQGDGTRSLLTLQTSYPLGTALARYIVRAELFSEAP